MTNQFKTDLQRCKNEGEQILSIEIIAIGLGFSILVLVDLITRLLSQSC